MIGNRDHLPKRTPQVIKKSDRKPSAPPVPSGCESGQKKGVDVHAPVKEK